MNLRTMLYILGLLLPHLSCFPLFLPQDLDVNIYDKEFSFADDWANHIIPKQVNKVMGGAGI